MGERVSWRVILQKTYLSDQLVIVFLCGESVHLSIPPVSVTTTLTQGWGAGKEDIPRSTGRWNNKCFRDDSR